jgi:ribosomal protein L31
MWKKQVCEQIHNHWQKLLQEEAACYLNIDACSTGKCHPIWALGTDPHMVTRATLQVKMLVQRYPINTSHTSNSRTTVCPCCKKADETMEHFIAECPALKYARDRHLNWCSQ